jgi:hypothetical protein
VKNIYFDESGTSPREPVAIVAGIIVDPDLQMRGLAEAIKQAVYDFVPTAARETFYFHATDVFGRYKKEFGWTIEHCNRLVERWLQIVWKFELWPIIGWSTKDRERFGSARANIVAHAGAFGLALQTADTILYANYRDEIGSVFMEDCPESRNMIRGVFESMASGEKPPIDWWKPEITNIPQGVAFLRKKDSIFLQFADAVAYAFQRYKMRLPGGDRLFHSVFGKPKFQIRRSWIHSTGGFILVPPRSLSQTDSALLLDSFQLSAGTYPLRSEMA